MKVLVAHNYYQQAGGEDQVVASEIALLEQAGHEVVRYTAHNASIATVPKVRLAAATTWNPTTYGELRAQLRRDRPAVVHFHNTFPIISPSAYQAARAEGVPVVQTLHNYRLLCPNALFFRDGGVCEDCLRKSVPWPGVVHACYRGSRQASAAVAAMLSIHRMLGTWTRDVDVYIALTEFARRKFIQGGLPADRIEVKANFVHPDPGVGDGTGGYALFVGRLAPEKGIETLLAAWERLKVDIQLKIVGDGPLAPLVAAAAEHSPRIEWLGARQRPDVFALMQAAAFLVFPSEWYEGAPVTIAEAFGVGLPVVSSDIGTMPELVEHDRTGLLFRAGDPDDLAARVQWAFSEPERLGAMRAEARAEFEAKYTGAHNYDALMAIYQIAIDRARSGEES